VWSARVRKYGQSDRFGNPGRGRPRDGHGRIPRMKPLGRLAQFVGLALPAVAVILELNRTITLGQMLVMLLAAVCCFWIGRIVEGYAGA
jgi:hypothetical protein